MNRRSVITGLGLICLALVTRIGIAGEAPVSALDTINVVKLISFDCSTCYQAETLDPPIRRLIADLGGRFVVAPLPRAESQSRERFYYALRDLGPEIERRARESLFRGTQELNYPLADAPQVLDWLTQDLGNLDINWDSIVAKVNAEEGGTPIARAIDLVVKSGAQVTPTYVLVRGGVVLSMFDVNSVPNTNLSALREAVLSAINTQSTPKR